MAKVTFQGRIPEELMNQVKDFCDDEGITPTMALEHIARAFFNPIAQDHADQGMLIKALEAEIEKLKLLAGKPITGKQYKPRSPFTKGCTNVYNCLSVHPDGFTSFEMERPLNDAANNIAARLKDLHIAGFVERTGKQRRGKKRMLDIWRVTSKTYLGL